MDPARLVFVGGIHRSGTTALAAALAEHPEVSGLRGTGAIENEGIYIQHVYPQLRSHGGMGRFALRDKAHLTESSPLATPANAQRLVDAWSPFWDLSRPVLVEKSPGNLIMGRFLQALFPGSALVVVVRHPVVVALATAKWDPLIITRKGRRRVGMAGQVRHWIRAHEILRDDTPSLTRLHVLRYEDLVEDPERQLSSIQERLGLDGPVPAGSIRRDRSTRYAQEWEHMRTGSLLQRRQRRHIEQSYGEAISAFGYDVDDLDARKPWPAS